MKKLLLVLIVVLSFMFLCACGEGEKQNEAEPTMAIITQAPATNTPVPTEDPSTPAPTPAPTPEPTPVPTIEPGKETYAGGIESESPIKYVFKTTSTQNEHRIVSESAAVQFFATVAFDGVSLSCPSYSDNIGTLVFELYKWMGTYDATLSPDNKPVATKEFVDYRDNSRNEMKFDTPMPDGEYLLYVTTPDASEMVGIWGKINLTGVPEERFYLAGEPLDDYASGIMVNYVKTPNVKAGPLSDPGL